ncbi:hypothetical protein [Streptomyces ipomoeae]|uniref:Uncharacterized protein n=1 Tax=Streptomyces ipomoeae 91-03 TaxID=698759 RepID=L1KLX4_9ACTN|nr:hypothetical protein [Streptomyces ipomoeae]EKX61564.1 hypothetical protein STRIP9103_02677 [Streptomyces ipomoeae 91-03]MDX2875240.1 hypothetical protein [Streptomyces ipomoeae]
MAFWSSAAPASFAPAADVPSEASALGEGCGGEADAGAEGEGDVCEGDGDGLLLGLGRRALPDGVDAGAPAPVSGFPGAGSTGDAPPSADASGALARTSSGSALSRSGVSYEKSPLMAPATATMPAAAVPARATTMPVRRRRRRGRDAQDGDEGRPGERGGDEGDEEDGEDEGGVPGVPCGWDTPGVPCGRGASGDQAAFPPASNDVTAGRAIVGVSWRGVVKP